MCLQYKLLKVPSPLGRQYLGLIQHLYPYIYVPDIWPLGLSYEMQILQDVAEEECAGCSKYKVHIVWSKFLTVLHF